MKPNVDSAMKTHSSRRPQGFTLVELLVVITIIAVLAGAGFAAGNAAVQKAKKVTALATCTSIEQAVNSFYTEYNSMPKAGLTTDTPQATPLDTAAADGKDLLEVLLGLETGATTLNNRAVRFFSGKEGKANKNGLIYGAGTPPTVVGLYDPWGGGYKVALDGDYDEIVTAKPKGGANATTLNGRRVAVWCDGADGVTATGKASDDVKTW